MMTIGQMLRGTITVVFVVLVLPVPTEFVIEYAREHGVFDHPSATIDTILMTATAAVENPWFIFILGVAFGGTLWMWASHFFRRLESARHVRTPSETEEPPAPLDPHIPPAKLPLGSVDVLKQRPPNFSLWRAATTAKIGELAAVCAGDDPSYFHLSSDANPYRQHIMNGVREGRIKQVDERRRIQTRAVLDEGDPGGWIYIDVPLSESSEVYVEDVRKYFAAKGVRTPLFDD